MAHIPVMPAEVLAGLAVRSGGVYVDGTFGAGGHSRLLAQAGARVVAFDVDPDAVVPPDLVGAVTLVRENFEGLAEALDALSIEAIDGALFDLGVSSMHLDRPERGFSIQHDGPLDMRMNPAAGASAYDLLARSSERELADLIFAFGEERASRRIARAIVRAREAGQLPATTAPFAALVARAAGVRGYWRIHPATRTFQALRIAVNDELGALERGLSAAIERTRPGGRVAVITFHSLEDRIVKLAFRDDARLRALSRKPVIASEDEVAHNPRARSAKLRIAERAA